MSIEKDLKREGIEVITQIDETIANHISKNIARRIYESFPDYEFTQEDIYRKLTKLTMYRAKMVEGMAEANYFYKNTSIYFNQHIDYEDIEEFAIHECIHYLQEVKDEQNNLLRLGLCTYHHKKPTGLALNEAAVQYTSSIIIGVDADYEKYYNIALYTPSPSYYPVECSLLNEILYFIDKDILFKSTLFSNDNFKNEIIKMSSEKTYNKILTLFDNILKYEEEIIKLNNKIFMYEDGDKKIDNINKKVAIYKEKIASSYIKAQNIIIKDFFDYEYSNVSNLEELEKFRHRLSNFRSIIGTTENYTYFDDYCAEMMNKLEHKCNVLENGGVETAIAKKHRNVIIEMFRKIFSKKSREFKSN